MPKKYQVFISSTFRDLIDERQDAMRSVLDLGHIASGMEVFPAADIEQFEYIKKVIDECDYYILLIGARYGSVDEAGVSFTEKEYVYAVEQKKTVLAFVHGDIDSIPATKAESDPAVVERLNRFRKAVSRGRLVQFWRARDDLKAKVIISLAKAISESPAVGWVRANVAASEELLDQINKLRIENDGFKRELEELRKAHPVLPARVFEFGEKFVLRFKLSGAGGGGTTSVTLSWREIFLAIGPILVRPQPAQMIIKRLELFLSENRDIINVLVFFSTDIELIMLQLIAYGLVVTHPINSDQGWIESKFKLTEEGQRQLHDQTIALNRRETAP
jgi:hypothetical protein